MFDAQPDLADEDFHLAPLRGSDADSLARAASDPLIWAGHPAPDRYKPEVFEPYFDSLLASGGALSIRETEGHEIIGCSRFYTAPDRPGTVAIGFTFLVRKHWGGRTNRAVKSLMLKHIFASKPEAWFHIAPSNLRSQVATERLGARFVETKDLALAG
ncbi:MAG: GNAT family N-acetyltransferase, partial [Pseudomonadota bacterium]